VERDLDDVSRLKAALENHYEIERELGRGGMATVYLARDIKHGGVVAIKVLRRELTAAVGAERFHREISIAAQLRHPPSERPAIAVTTSSSRDTIPVRSMNSHCD